VESAVPLQDKIDRAQRQVKTDAYPMSIGEIVNMYEARELECRNFIAHGATVALDETEQEDMIERTIGLMRSFQNCIENAALLGAYKRAS
jgi:hypothetical protein